MRVAVVAKQVVLEEKVLEAPMVPLPHELVPHTLARDPLQLLQVRKAPSVEVAE